MKKILLALAAAATLSAASAADLYGVRVHTEPAAPYVGQDFRIVIDVESSPDCEVSLRGLSGLPGTNTLVTGAVESLPVTERRDGDATRHVHTFRAPARALRPIDMSPRSSARVDLTSRTSRGFFSSWSTSTRSATASWDRLLVRPLPEEGRPDGFGGAVGRFSVSLAATPSEVAVGDIVTLSLVVRGDGNLGGTAPTPPALPPALFKAYPPKAADPPGGALLAFTQEVIPLSTQAMEIASATLPYFDPVAGRYRVAASSAARLSFRERSGSEAPAVREVVVSGGEAPAAERAISVELSASSFGGHLPLMLGLAGGALLALVAFATLRSLGLRRPALWMAAVLALEAVGGRALLHSRAEASATLDESAVLRLAPSPSAKVVAELPAGTPVVPLETAGRWTRVRAAGHAGWMAR